MSKSVLPTEEARIEESVAAVVREGLTAGQKRLPPWLFYDEAGSQLFERITELPEYYPTRREIGILEAHTSDIAALIPIIAGAGGIVTTWEGELWAALSAGQPCARRRCCGAQKSLHDWQINCGE